MGSQRYQVCGDSCSHSCKDISLNPRCKTQCVEGCNCPEGQTLDKNGECIQVSECPCIHDNEEFAAGHREIRTGADGLDLWYVKLYLLFYFSFLLCLKHYNHLIYFLQ
jgi:hypothetical protein